MKNSKFYFDKNRNQVEIWSEESNGNIDYWEKIKGVSYSLTKRQYENRIKKQNL